MAKRKSVGLEPFEAADKEAELFKQRPFDDDPGGELTEFFNNGEEHQAESPEPE